MSRSAGQELPAAIDGVRAEMEAWRARRRRGERIPGDVWRSVVRAAQRHGVHRVSRTLGLDYVGLKRRVAQANGDTGRQEDVFVEVEGSAVATGAACVVELEKGNGTRMRICVRDGAGVDWGKLKEAFLGA